MVIFHSYVSLPEGNHGMELCVSLGQQLYMFFRGRGYHLISEGTDRCTIREFMDMRSLAIL